jgi:predicted phosphodiesterase
MKVAVVSDIHANYQALAAVLAEVAREKPDELWCLGDIVGYGPQPNLCCLEIAARASLCLAGNHDLAVIGAISIEDFNGDAGAAALWTRGVLDEDSRAFLSSLSPLARRPGIALFHASPLDPVWDYVLSFEGARLSIEAAGEPLVLVGHSHVALKLSYDGRIVDGGVAAERDEVDLGSSRWLLNPGSVGQPRGGDPRASWLMLDLDAKRASFRRTVYPIELTQSEIRAAGLPETLAARLELGQ